MRFGVLCLLVGLVACGGKSGSHANEGDKNIVLGSEDAGSTKCVDNDDDGFGHGCSAGPDCDDDDPDVTDECTRCVAPNKGCPCEPGTMPLTGCKPPKKRVTQNGVMGFLVCREGSRY